MIWQFIKKNYLLIIILFLATFLRLYRLSSVPLALHNDEAMNVYVGRFILENGVDLYGHSWPLIYFDKFGDYPPVIPMYLSALPTFIFGLNKFGIRFASAFIGSLSVLLIYLLASKLFKNKSSALLSALLLAISPGHLILSRASAEGIIGVFIFLVALYFLFFWLEQEKNLQIITSSFLFFLTYFIYPSFRILVPLSLLPVTLICQTKKSKRSILFITVIFFLLTFLISHTQWGQGRYQQTSILHYGQEIKGKAINYSLGLGANKILQARIFHNRYILALRESLRQYASYFSPSFLTSDGLKPERYTVPEHGSFYWVFYLVLTISILLSFFSKPSQTLSSLWQKKFQKIGFLLVYLFFISPIPAAMTMEDTPNLHRSILFLLLIPFIFSLLFNYCLIMIKKNFFKKIFSSLILIVLLLESIHFFHYYFGLHTEATTTHRNEAQEILSKWLLENHDKYQQIYLPAGNAMPIHYLLFKKDFDKKYSHLFKTNLEIEKIDNLVFIDNNCQDETLLINQSISDDKKNLIIDQYGCNLSDPLIKEIAVLDYHNLLHAFSIREYSR